jgi:hypothetical protein
MINGTITPVSPKPNPISWLEMILPKNVGKVYKVSEESRDYYRFITLANGSSLFVQLDSRSEIQSVEHAEKDVWSNYHFVLTGETINLSFK